MMINATNPSKWKNDVHDSVKLYNSWFLDAAPKAYRDTRQDTVIAVEEAFTWTSDLTSLTADVLKQHPNILPTLRMSTSPPLARDRLIGLAGCSKSMVNRMEQERKLPVRMAPHDLHIQLDNVCKVVLDLLDLDLFEWCKTRTSATPKQRELAATVVADRLCGAMADPIVRNAQERRQLSLIEAWLVNRGYRKQPHPSHLPLTAMEPGTFSFRQNVVVGTSRPVNIPIDVVIQPHRPTPHGLPVLVEAKSAGDFTNTNKRRKEEAQKLHQLREKHGVEASLLLFLCGYFDTGYLGYSAAEGLDWVWEHRIDDLEQAGI